MSFLDRLRQRLTQTPVVREDDAVVPVEDWRVDNRNRNNDVSGIYVTETVSGNKFFVTRCGGVFCIGGPVRDMLDEDFLVTGERADYIKGRIK